MAMVHPSPDAQGLSHFIYCCTCPSTYGQHGLQASPATPPHATRGRRLVIPSTHLARSHTGAEPSASLSSMHREQLYQERRGDTTLWRRRCPCHSDSLADTTQTARPAAPRIALSSRWCHTADTSGWYLRDRPCAPARPRAVPYARGVAGTRQD